MKNVPTKKKMVSRPPFNQQQMEAMQQQHELLIGEVDRIVNGAIAQRDARNMGSGQVLQAEKPRPARLVELAQAQVHVQAQGANLNEQLRQVREREIQLVKEITANDTLKANVEHEIKLIVG